MDGAAWLGHIDTDELVYPASSGKYSMHEILSHVPSHVRPRSAGDLHLCHTCARRLSSRVPSCGYLAACGNMWCITISMVFVSAMQHVHVPLARSCSHMSETADAHVWLQAHALILPNYEALPEHDRVEDPMLEVTLFKSAVDHIDKNVMQQNYRHIAHGNPNYFIAYSNGKSLARVEYGLRPHGAHRWASYNGTFQAYTHEQAAVLHYTYNRCVPACELHKQEHGAARSKQRQVRAACWRVHVGSLYRQEV